MMISGGYNTSSEEELSSSSDSTEEEPPSSFLGDGGGGGAGAGDAVEAALVETMRWWAAEDAAQAEAGSADEGEASASASAGAGAGAGAEEEWSWRRGGVDTPASEVRLCAPPPVPPPVRMPFCCCCAPLPTIEEEAVLAVPTTIEEEAVPTIEEEAQLLLGVWKDNFDARWRVERSSGGSSGSGGSGGSSDAGGDVCARRWEWWMERGRWGAACVVRHTRGRWWCGSFYAESPVRSLPNRVVWSAGGSRARGGRRVWTRAEEGEAEEEEEEEQARARQERSSRGSSGCDEPGSLPVCLCGMPGLCPALLPAVAAARPPWPVSAVAEEGEAEEGEAEEEEEEEQARARQERSSRGSSGCDEPGSLPLAYPAVAAARPPWPVSAVAESAAAVAPSARVSGSLPLAYQGYGTQVSARQSLLWLRGTEWREVGYRNDRDKVAYTVTAAPDDSLEGDFFVSKVRLNSTWTISEKLFVDGFLSTPGHALLYYGSARRWYAKTICEDRITWAWVISGRAANVWERTAPGTAAALSSTLRRR